MTTSLDQIRLQMTVAPTPPEINTAASAFATSDSRNAQIEADARLAAAMTREIHEKDSLRYAQAETLASPRNILRELEEEMVRQLPQSPQTQFRRKTNATAAAAAIHNSPRIAQANSMGHPSPMQAAVEKDENCCLICMDDFTERRRPYPLPCVGTCTGAFVHYRCIMAWLGQSGSCPLCRGPCDPLSMEPTQSLDFSNIKAMVMRPVPLDAGMV